MAELTGTAPQSASRYRLAALTAISYGGGRAITFLSSLVFAPLVFHYLGPARFGIWVTLTSAIGLVGFSDLGIGNGLVSAVARAYGEEDPDGVRRSVATAACLLTAVTGVLALVFLAVYWLVPWPSVLNTRVGGSEVDAAVATTAACFLLGLPFVLAEKTELGVQRGYIAGAWLAAGNTLGLLIAVAAIIGRADVAVFVAATLGSTAIASAANCAYWFGGRFRAYRPRIRDFSRSAVRSLLGVGGLFLAIDVTVAVAFASDPIVVNQVLGPAAAAQFWLPVRLFTVVPVACSLVLMALWPAYGEALARGDYDWISRTLRRSLVIGLLSSVVVGAGLATLGAAVIRAWIGRGAHPSHLLLLALGVWTVLLVTGSVISTFLAGVRVMRLQAACALLMACVNLPLSIVWAHTIGISGVVWASVVTYAALMLLPYAIIVPRILGRLRSADRSRAQTSTGAV